MPTATPVLELNGRQYDALTGRLVRPRPAPPKSIDGFFSAGAPHAVPPRVAMPAHQPKTIAAKPQPLPAAQKPQPSAISRPHGHPVAPHKADRSHTLMRTSVTPPGQSFKRHIQVSPHTGTLVPKPRFDVVPKHAAKAVDADRLRRARRIAKSALVQHFAMGTSQTPGAARTSTATYRPRLTPAPQHRDVRAAAAPATVAVSSKTKSAPTSYEDVFERALAAAAETRPTTKHAPAHHRPGLRRLRQFASIAASSVAVLVIVGFVAYQNAAVIQLKLASSRAGISATLPAWQPSGFHLGTFAYGPGNLTVTYRSDSGQHFAIAQTASSWDSATLLSDYVYPNNNSYNTITSGGSTIYTYGNNNATWVSGGIWYKLTTDGSLSTSQIVNIATSMQS